MKNIFFTIAMSAILLSSCGNDTNKKTDMHTHEDGSEHVNHDNAFNEAPEQELFEIEHDSISAKKDTLKSDAKKEHSHSHEGGHEHKH